MGPGALGPADPMVTLDSLDDQAFTQLCADDPRQARELVRGLALKISPDALMVLYRKLTANETAPAEVLKMASEVFSIAGVRQGPQSGDGVVEPKFTIAINIGGQHPQSLQPVIDIQATPPHAAPAFDELVLRPEG
jgi:hypothetical protein